MIRDIQQGISGGVLSDARIDLSAQMLPDFVQFVSPFSELRVSDTGEFRRLLLPIIWDTGDEFRASCAEKISDKEK